MSFVEVDDIKISAAYGVEEFPTLVFFKHGIPSICEQDLTDNEEVSVWMNVDRTHGSRYHVFTNATVFL